MARRQRARARTQPLIGAVVLSQIPTAADLAGIALVVAGVALHRAPDQEH